MTIAECHAYLDLLLDKSESPYLTDAEKDSLITQACIEYTKRHLPSVENQGINVEVDQINYGNLYSLVYATAGAAMNSSGIITVSTVQTALNTASGSTEPFMTILGVNWTKSGVTYPSKWTPHNQWFSYINNAFKVSTSNPRYKFDKTNFTFSPIDTNASVSFVLIKQPKATSLSGGTTIELPAHCHKAIVELAVDLAATSLRDPDLKQLNAG